MVATAKDVTKDDTIVLPPSYAARKTELQKIWKPQLIKLRGEKCEVCGRDGSPIEPGHDNALELAHITNEEDFFRVRWKTHGESQSIKDMELGYSEDNLLILCHECHGIMTPKGRYYTFETVWEPKYKRLCERINQIERQDNGPVRQWNDAINSKDYEAARKVETVAAVKEYLEIKKEKVVLHSEIEKLGQQRRTNVRKLQEGHIAVRGWKTPADVIAKNDRGIVHDWIAAGLVPNDRCQFPGAERSLAEFKAGRCAMGPDGCAGATGACWNCRIKYCQTHGPLHAVVFIQEAVRIYSARRVAPIDEANMTMTKKWIEAGWVPVNKCVYPGGETEFVRYSRHECISGPDACSGEVEWCPDCNVTFCAAHGPRHRVGANQ